MKSILIPSALAFCLSATAATASTVAITPGLPGWQELTFDGLTPNRWREDGGALTVESDSSVSMLYTSVSVDTVRTPVLRWRWRVDQTPPATVLTRKGGDDRPLSLTVGFAYDSASASMGERMKRVIVEQVAGADAPGRVIDLTWGGTEPRGRIAESPYSGSAGRIVTVRGSGAPTGEWIEESVDIAALYRQAWGAEPPPVTRIAISADSDDTRSRASSRVADIRFETR